GVAALGLNAAANGVAITVVGQDITAGRPPPVDVVAAGDLFYGQDLADRVIPFLDRCLAARINVLIGDPGRAYLP
ncbi:MAG: methyltransferase, partial [Mesorhizobium sp.]